MSDHGEKAGRTLTVTIRTRHWATSLAETKHWLYSQSWLLRIYKSPLFWTRHCSAPIITWRHLSPITYQHLSSPIITWRHWVRPGLGFSLLSTQPGCWLLSSIVVVVGCSCSNHRPSWSGSRCRCLHRPDRPGCLLLSSPLGFSSLLGSNLGCCTTSPPASPAPSPPSW